MLDEYSNLSYGGRGGAYISRSACAASPGRREFGSLGVCGAGGKRSKCRTGVAECCCERVPTEPMPSFLSRWACAVGPCLCAELQTDVAASRDSNGNDGCAGCWGHRDATSKIYALSSTGLSPYGDLFRAGSTGQARYALCCPGQLATRNLPSAP